MGHGGCVYTSHFPGGLKGSSLVQETGCANTTPSDPEGTGFAHTGGAANGIDKGD